MQKAIEVGEYNFKRAIVDNLGETDVARLLDNKRACHLLQKVIEHVNEEDVDVVVYACYTRAPQFVMHPNGCHVLRVSSMPSVLQSNALFCYKDLTKSFTREL